MYGLPNQSKLNWLGKERLEKFKSILSEEVEEADEIIENMSKSPSDQLESFTMLADWLGDIMVYCASEARRWGIPIEHVLKDIMESNFSKSVSYTHLTLPTIYSV